MEVPILPVSGSKSQFLCMLFRLRKVEDALNWTNSATLYVNFENQMGDTSDWDAISNPFPNSVACYNGSMDAYSLGACYYSKLMLGWFTGAWWWAGRRTGRNHIQSLCPGQHQLPMIKCWSCYLVILELEHLQGGWVLALVTTTRNI